jgi:arylsulfatase A-like enzyme
MRRALIALIVAAAGLACAPGRPAPGPVRVVLVTIDTLRYDGLEGGPRGPSRMPLTRARAAAGRAFERAFASTCSTQPSHASMFTGLHPWEHGVTRNGLTLAADRRTVAESLSQAGFETFAVVASVPVSARFGFAQGFQRFAEPFDRRFGVETWEGVDVPAGRFYALADTVTDEAMRQLDAAKGRRQFLWVHYFDPHSPYGDSDGSGRMLTPAEVVSRMAGGPVARAGLADEARDGYGRDVQALDRSLDRLLARLEKDRARFETHVAVTADHGESLGEDQVIGHGNHLVPEQIHVPLFILSRAFASGTDRRVTGSVDLAATLLKLAGVGERLGNGHDLSAPPAAAALAVGMRRTYDHPLDALRADGRRERFDGYLFYAVDADGAVRTGNGRALGAETGADAPGGSEARALTALFQRFEGQLAGRPAAAPLDPETERALRALGYVN